MTLLESKAVSLYVHIPFCQKKCDYCDFFSLPCGASATAVPDSYIEALIREITFYARQYKIHAWKTVYIGGGTPSLLNVMQLKRLMTGIWNVVGGKRGEIEVTMEMNPESVTEPLLDACAGHGISRISLGVQSFNDDALAAVHRTATGKSALRALRLLSDRWKGEVSGDLIAGLPKESATSFKNGVEILASFPVHHVSLYSLTVENGTPLATARDSGAVTIDKGKIDRLWISGRSLLEKSGLRQYEVSNFARSDAYSMHNSAYWRLEPYIGCGAGATGSWYGEPNTDGSAGCGNGLRWSNTRDVAAYTDFWRGVAPDAETNERTLDDAPRETEVLDEKTQRFEYLMLGFRMLDGVSARAYQRRFNAPLADAIGATNGAFTRWQERHLARIIPERGGDDVCYALNKRGLLLLNQFLKELL